MRLNTRLSTLVALMVVGVASSLQAEDLLEKHVDLVKASLIADVDSVSPGSSFMLGVHLKMKPHWHTYWVNPGESGEATKIKFTGPQGVEFGAVRWPLPTAMESFGAITYGYEDEALLLVPVKVGAQAKLEGGLKIDAHVVWLACLDTCIEGEATLNIALPVSKSKPAPANGPQFAKWIKQLPASSHTAVAAIEQKKKDGAPLSVVEVKWNEAPKKVEWFPIATPAVAIEDIVLKHEGVKTVIQFKPNVYRPDRVPGGKVDGVIVFEDGKGQRVGVAMSFVVPIEE